MDIPRTLAAAFNAGDLPETLVICGPRLHLHSAGHHGTLKAGTIDIPIRALDQSVSGWSQRFFLKDFPTVFFGDFN